MSPQTGQSIVSWKTPEQEKIMELMSPLNDFLKDGYYYLVTASLFDSKYVGGDDQLLPGRAVFLPTRPCC